VGLKDDYAHEGRALVEKFTDRALPSAVEDSDNFVELSRALKQISAPLGPLGLATLHASTVAMESGTSSDDSTYTSIETQLASFTDQRDQLVAQILPLLEAAEFGGTRIPEDAEHLIHEARRLLSIVKDFAGDL